MDMVRVEIPIRNYMMANICSSFRNTESTRYPNYFVVWNDKATEFLSKNLPLYTGDTVVFNVNDTLFILFDWHIQRYLVGA